MIEFLMHLQTKQSAIYNFLKKSFIVTVFCLLGLVVALEVADAKRGYDRSSYSNSSYAQNYDDAISYQDAAKLMEPTEQSAAFIALVDNALQDDLEITDEEMPVISTAYQELNNGS